MPIAGAIGKPSDKAGRPESPVPSGFRRNGLICFVAQLANSTNYSLRRDASHLKPLRQKRETHVGLVQRFPNHEHAACAFIPATASRRVRSRATRGEQLDTI